MQNIRGITSVTMLDRTWIWLEYENNHIPTVKGVMSECYLLYYYANNVIVAQPFHN